MFVESFQGQYKDGTDGTFDFRMLSASFLILRILTMTSFLASIFSFEHQVSSASAELQCTLFVGASILYAVMRPYKLNLSNNIDYLILTLLGTISIELIKASYNIQTVAFRQYFLVSMLLVGVPHIVLIFCICYMLAKKAGIIQCLKRKYETLKARVQATRHASQAVTDMEAESDTGSLPDRLINPGEYEPVLLSTEEHTVAEATENKDPVANKERRMLTPVYTYGSIS